MFESTITIGQLFQFLLLLCAFIAFCLSVVTTVLIQRNRHHLFPALRSRLFRMSWAFTIGSLLMIALIFLVSYFLN